jgi:2-polyprenyl-6-methoxyphenol hydroxylase-like FAD-dependent oxidoreductase
MPTAPSLATTTCVVGGGPAGAMLGLLLARAGIDVIVLEKHADFLRDFRGDIVHPATLEVLDELGLAKRFHELPHRKVSTMGIIRDGQRTEMADFGKLKLRFPYLMFIPQWDFLDFITGEAARYSNFRLLMQAEAYDVHRENGRVAGIRFRGPDGERAVRACLTVAADGRDSVLRRAVGFQPRRFGVATDLVMFCISRYDTDPDEGLCLRIGNGKALGLIDRKSYWQAFYGVPKRGEYGDLRHAGIETLRQDVVRLAPFLADRIHEITFLQDTNFLEVRLDRLRRWHAPGLLFIGDAAHAMSPVGGFGVNLAIQDAVAAANLLAEPLRRHQQTREPIEESALAAVQRRRNFPTIATHALQRLIERFGAESVRHGGLESGRQKFGNLFGRRFELLKKPISHAIGIGFRPEHVRVPLATTPRQQ